MRARAIGLGLGLGLGLGGCGFSHGAALGDGAPADVAGGTDAAVTTGSLFVPDYLLGILYRYAISDDPNAPPAPVPFDIAGALSPLVLPSGELFLGEITSQTIARYLTPLATPTANGTITGDGLATTFGKMALVDQELWVVNFGGANLDRIAFDVSGNASMAGADPLGNGRGIVYVPATRDLYVSQCCGVDTIVHYRVAGDHSLSALPSLTGNGLSNPHGLLVTPWGELFVCDAGSNEILRFTRDAEGVLTANGAITDNGLSTPLDLVLTPWRELYVSNQGTGTISRFTLDAAHVATANGTFAVPSAMMIGWIALAE